MFQSITDWANIFGLHLETSGVRKSDLEITQALLSMGHSASQQIWSHVHAPGDGDDAQKYVASVFRR